jgi:uncharacterized protein YxjI
MGLRDRREDRREERQDERSEFGRGGTALRFQMRERLLSVGDDYWIEDSEGTRVFHVDGKAVRVRDTFELEDAHGNVVAQIRSKMVRVRDTMTIENADGSSMATVKKALVSPLRDRFQVEVEGGEDLEVQGNILDHEYEMERDGRKVAEVSKKWFRVRESYGVEVADPADAVLVLAVTVALESMTDGVG